MKWDRTPFLFVMTMALLTSGCLTPTSPKSPDSNLNTEPQASPTVSVPNTAKAVRVVFKTDSSTGSFTGTLPNNGKSPGEGLGFSATQFFDPSGTRLTSLPAWFQGLEIGISGADNTGATADACARFAIATEDDVENCALDGDTVVNDKCYVSSSYFRVSEKDCNTATPGNGTKDDPIYIRAYFSRAAANLGASENIMAVVEYAATSYHNSSAYNQPTLCFTGGEHTPETCADFTWRAFLRKSGTDTIPKSFMMFVPPTNNNVENGKAGGNIATKQFILPLASNTDLNVFQLSRTGSRLHNNPGTKTGGIGDYGDFDGVCKENSPLCAGMVIYAITFYRI